MIQDIHIIGEDIDQDPYKNVVLIQDLDVVTQDIKHMILESGLLCKLLAERSKRNRSVVYNALKILVESDSRIIPGTADIQENYTHLFTLSATSDKGSFLLNFETKEK